MALGEERIFNAIAFLSAGCRVCAAGVKADGERGNSLELPAGSVKKNRRVEKRTEWRGQEQGSSACKLGPSIGGRVSEWKRGGGGFKCKLRPGCTTSIKTWIRRKGLTGKGRERRWGDSTAIEIVGVRSLRKNKGSGVLRYTRWVGWRGENTTRRWS